MGCLVSVLVSLKDRNSLGICTCNAIGQLLVNGLWPSYHMVLPIAA